MNPEIHSQGNTTQEVGILRPIHTRGFAPGACSRDTLREQSSSMCTNDFMGILHPREQNFHPAKCSTIFNRLNILEQAPGANWPNLKTLPRVYWHVQNEPGVCPGYKTPRVYWPLWADGIRYRKSKVSQKQTPSTHTAAKSKAETWGKKTVISLWFGSWLLLQTRIYEFKLCLFC